MNSGYLKEPIEKNFGVKIFLEVIYPIRKFIGLLVVVLLLFCCCFVVEQIGTDLLDLMFYCWKWQKFVLKMFF